MSDDVAVAYHEVEPLDVLGECASVADGDPFAGDHLALDDLDWVQGHVQMTPDDDVYVRVVSGDLYVVVKA